MAKAYDAAGNIGTSSPVSVTLRNDTVSPVIGNINLTDGIVVSPTKQVVSASATDNQGVARMSLSIDGKEVTASNGGSISYSWNTRKVAKGGHSIIVRASDAGGNATSRTVTVYR